MREPGSALKGRHQTEMTSSSDGPQVRLHPGEGGGQKAREHIHQNHLNHEETQASEGHKQSIQSCVDKDQVH